MSQLTVRKTQIHSWHELVVEAESVSHILLPEDTEYYLVSLLSRYTDQPEFINNVMADLFLRLDGMKKAEKHVCLRDIGDQCLLFAGLFPEYASKRLVSDDYFPGLGKAAYDRLSLEVSLYLELVQYFESMLRILRTFRQLSGCEENELVNNEACWVNIELRRGSHCVIH